MFISKLLKVLSMAIILLAGINSFGIGTLKSEKIEWKDSHSLGEKSSEQCITTLSDSKVLEIYAGIPDKRKNDFVYHLYYRFGEIDNDKSGVIKWDKCHNTGISIPSETEENPDLAVTAVGSNKIVCAYVSGHHPYTVVGRLNSDNTILFGSSYKIETTVVNVSLATLCDDRIAMVYNLFVYNNLLYSCIGKINGSSVTWENLVSYIGGEGGRCPSITAIGGNKVVEIHKNEFSNDLLYSIGTININTINWGEPCYIEGGRFPSISAAPDGRVVQIHQGEERDTINYRVGDINNQGDKIEWSNSYCIENGKKPCITFLPSGEFVQIHQSENTYVQFYRIGYLKENLVDQNCKN